MQDILPFIISQAWGLWPDFSSISDEIGPGAGGVHRQHNSEVQLDELGNDQQQQQPPPPSYTAVQTTHYDPREGEGMADLQAALRVLEAAGLLRHEAD